MEMKKAVCLVLVVLVLLFAITILGYARDGGGGYSHGGGGYYGGGRYYGGGVWIGPGWGGWDPWWWGSPYYWYNPYSPYYPETSAIIQQQPQAYVQPTPQPAEQYYWYFCPNPQGYYPYVKKCPTGWLKVVPPTALDDEQ